jgi:mRNA interferase HigB
VHILTPKRLTEFAKQHAETEGTLAAWKKMIESKRYTKSSEVKADFPKVDFLDEHRAVFNIAKQYRLVCDMRFDLSRVFIRHIVTHEQYERLMKKGRL